MASNKVNELNLEDINPSKISLSPMLDFIKFELSNVSPTCIQGKFIVSEKSAQALGFLNGGATAIIAESVGSFGAFLAAGCQRVAGVELTTTHLQSAPIGVEVQVKATPIHVGRRLQVWEISFFAAENPSIHKSKISKSGLIALSKLIATVIPSNSDEISHTMKALLSKL